MLQSASLVCVFFLNKEIMFWRGTYKRSYILNKGRLDTTQAFVLNLFAS